jgi:hypothetical protein
MRRANESRSFLSRDYAGTAPLIGKHNFAPPFRRLAVLAEDSGARNGGLRPPKCAGQRRSCWWPAMRAQASSIGGLIVSQVLTLCNASRLSPARPLASMAQTSHRLAIAYFSNYRLRFLTALQTAMR